MGIAAGDAAFAEALGELGGQLVGRFQHLAIQGFDAVKVAGEEGEIFICTFAGEAGIDVVDGDEEAAFVRVGEQTPDVGTAALELDVIVFGDAVDPRVDFGPAGHVAGDFFAEKKIRIAAEIFDRVDRIVIGYGDKVHTARLGRGI